MNKIRIITVVMVIRILAGCSNQGVQSVDPLDGLCFDSFFLIEHGVFKEDIWYEFKKGQRIYPLTTDSMAYSAALQSRIFLELLCEDTLFVITDSPVLFNDSTHSLFFHKKDLEDFFGLQFKYEYADKDLPMGVLIYNDKDTFVCGKTPYIDGAYNLEYAIVQDGRVSISKMNIGMSPTKIQEQLHLVIPQNIKYQYLFFIWPPRRIRDYPMWYDNYFDIKDSLQLHHAPKSGRLWSKRCSSFDMICIEFKDDKVFRVWLSNIYGNESFVIPNCNEIWKDYRELDSNSNL